MIFEMRGDNEIPIFTTNYDCVIEEFCHENGLVCIDGFRRDSQIDEFAWNPDEFKRSTRKNRAFKLFKLHGSLNWRRRQDYAAVKVEPEEITKGSKKYKENLLVYPTEKLTNELERVVIPEKEPFGYLHILFKEIYTKSDAAIFIGFNFRDEYLNEIIIDCSAEKKIVVLTPHASELKKKIEEPNGPIGPIPILPKRKIVAIDSSFGKFNTINKIEEAISK